MSTVRFCWSSSGYYDMINTSNYTITEASYEKERELYQEFLPMIAIDEVLPESWEEMLLGNIVDSDVTLAEYLRTNHPEFLL